MSWRRVSGPAHQANLPGSLKLPSFGSLPESSGSEPSNARSFYKRPPPKGRGGLQLPQCHGNVGVMRMRWFRSRARLGSGLALFALVAQLTLSFGHLHADASARDLGVAAAASNMQPSADQTSTPSDRSDHQSIPDDYCPICALIHLAYGMVPAAAPPLSLRDHFGRLHLELAVELGSSTPRATAFQARAPPTA